MDWTNASVAAQLSISQLYLLYLSLSLGHVAVCGETAGGGWRWRWLCCLLSEEDFSLMQLHEEESIYMEASAEQPVPHKGKGRNYLHRGECFRFLHEYEVVFLLNHEISLEIWSLYPTGAPGFIVGLCWLHGRLYKTFGFLSLFFASSSTCFPRCF